MEFINKIKQNYEQWARVTPQGLLYDRCIVLAFCRAIADWFNSGNFCFNALQCTRI